MEDFDDVYVIHRAKLLRLAGVLCGDRALAEDVVAEAFARTLPKWKRGKVDDPGAYLRRCVVNLLTSKWRRRSRRPPADRPNPVPSPDDSVVVRDEVWSALLELPMPQRAVIVLRHLEDRSEADTAELLGIPLGTVKSSNARALDRLRDVLTEESHDHA